MEAAAATAFDAQGAVARHVIDKPLELRQIVRQDRYGDRVLVHIHSEIDDS
jgi:hypothetical protein